LPTATDKTTGLHLSLDFSKRSYVLGEPIIVRVSINNAGKTPVTDRWFAYTRGFTLELEDAEGHGAQMNVLYVAKAQAITDWVFTVLPGQTVTTTFDLVRGSIIGSTPVFPRFADFAMPSQQRIPGYAVAPGVYRLTATHSLPMNKTEDGNVIILQVSKEFTLRAPTAQEKEALTLFETVPQFTSADAKEAEKAAEKSQQDALAAYQRVWSEYPTTPFAPYALYYSGRIHQYQGELGAAADAYSLLMQRFPQFPLTAEVLYHHSLALHGLAREQDARQLAGILAQRYQNHLIEPDVPMKEKGSRIRLLLKELGMEAAE
jgi:hypothetical protein